jgi:hypothetical protein
MSYKYNKCILFIQKKILFKSFIRTLYKYKNIFNTISKIKDFNNMTKYINNKMIISNVNDILNKYYNWLYYNTNITDYILIAPMISAKQFLSSFLFYYYPEFVTTENNIINDDIIKFSKNLINLFNDILHNNILLYCDTVRKFVKSLNQYINCFNQFMIQDKQIKTKELIDKWIDLEKTKNLIYKNDKYEDKANVILCMEEEQNKTIKYIKIIDNNFDTDILNHIYKLNITIEETMVLCYFDNLKKDIISNEYKILKNVLTEIKDNIIMLYKKSEKELDEYMDVDFIIQKINNNVFPIEDFISIADYCISWIKILQAPIKTENTMKKWDIIKTSVDIDNINMEEYGKVYANIATSTIHFILDELVDIKNDIISMIIKN